MPSPLKLWAIPFTPFPRRVLLYLKLKGIPKEDIEIVYMDFSPAKGMTGDPEKPAGSVPILQLEDGTLIRQSMGVLQYLEERYAHLGPNLSGSTAVERAQIRDMCSLIDEAATYQLSYMLHASSIFTGLNPHQSKPEAEANKMFRDKALATLAAWSATTSGFLLGGEKLTLADVTLFILIQFNRQLYGDDLAQGLPRLEEFYQAMSKLEGTEAPEHPEHLSVLAKGRVEY